MQQDNTWQDKGPGKETSKPRQKSRQTRHKTRKQERQEKYTLKKVHTQKFLHTQKAVDFAQKAAKRIYFLHVYISFLHKW